MKTMIVTVLVVVVLVSVNVVSLISRSRNPRMVVLPSTRIERLENQRYRNAVEKLSDDERVLLNGFFVMWRVTGGGDFPNGFTIGNALDAQQEVLMEAGYQFAK